MGRHVEMSSGQEITNRLELAFSIRTVGVVVENYSIGEYGLSSDSDVVNSLVHRMI